MQFGNLRSAVESAKTDRKRVGDVIWCILKSEQRDVALDYALSHLDGVCYANFSGTKLNIKDVIEFVVCGADSFKKRVLEHATCSDNLLWEFLAAWAQCILRSPSNAPDLSIVTFESNFDLVKSYNNIAGDHLIDISDLSSDKDLCCLSCYHWQKIGISEHLL